MISRCMKLIVYVALSTTLATCQLQFAKEGYVGVNFNAGGGLGGLVSGSGAGDVAKTYEKTYESDHSAGANIGGSVVKTIEVPAPAVHSSIYFEKQIQPVKPVLVQKEVEYHPAPAVIKPAPLPVVADTVVTKEIVAPAPQNVYVTKHVYGRRPAHPRRKYVYVNADTEVAPPRVGFLTKLFAVGAAPAPAPAPAVVHTEVQKQVVVPQNTVQHHNTATYTATANVNKNGQLFNDIFNIPISTLQAVNNLVNNIVGGVSVTKQVNTHAVKTVATDAHVNSNANANANAYVHAEGHVQG